MSVLGYLSVLIIWGLVSSVALVFSLILTNPAGIGPLGVTAWFVVFLLWLATVLALGLYTVKTFLHVHTTGAQRLRYSWRQGLLLSFLAIGLVALSSLQQLGPLDAILLALLLGIVEVYVRFRWP